MNNIVSKIEKLLALASNNSNEQEAQAALLKAQKLMAEYGIEQSELTGEKIAYKTTISKVKGHGYFSKLAMIIGESFSCKVIIIGGKCCFFGREDYADAALSAFTFAYNVMQKNARRICRENGFDPARKGAAQIYNSYFNGFVRGLKSKMDEQCKALMIVVPQDVKDEFCVVYPSIRMMKRKGTTRGTDYSAYATGFQDGRTAMRGRELHA